MFLKLSDYVDFLRTNEEKSQRKLKELCMKVFLTETSENLRRRFCGKQRNSQRANLGLPSINSAGFLGDRLRGRKYRYT